MIRVYKDFLRRLLLVSLHYRDLGYTLKTSTNYAIDYWYKRSHSQYHKPEVQRLLSFLEDGSYSPNEQDLTEVIDMMVKQLTAKEDNNDRDLIDTIVRILMLPHAKNCLSGSTLTSLRNAILLPEEVITFKANAEKELHCTNCNHKLIAGEMAVFNGQGPGNRGFYCIRCQRPSYMASDTDEAVSIPVPKAVATALSKRNTESVAEKSKTMQAAQAVYQQYIVAGGLYDNPPAAVPPTPAPQNDLIGWINDNG